MAKGKFLYVVKKDGENRVFIKDETFSGYPEGTKFDLDTGVGLNLSSLSTDDLLKLKAQIASYLETRMDLDEVVEGNFEKLQTKVRNAKGEVVAQLMRQTLDRIDLNKADLKRSETRLQILSDEMKRRMVESGESEIKYNGLVNVSYKGETVFNVGEDGWEPVYESILEEANSLKTKGKSIVEAFAIIQKRLTSTTLKELVAQGEELPNGVEQMTVHKIKVLRNKK